MPVNPPPGRLKQKGQRIPGSPGGRGGKEEEKEGKEKEEEDEDDDRADSELDVVHVSGPNLK